MKTARKPIALLTALSLLLTLWTPIAINAATPTEMPAATTAAPEAQPQRDGVLYAGGELLEVLDNGAAMRYVYDRIMDAILSDVEECDIPLGDYTLTEEELRIIRSVLYAICPETIYWNGVDLDLYDDRVVYQEPWGNPTRLTANHILTLQRVAELTADLEGKSDYEKSRILFERLVYLNTYEDTPNDQTAYGALVEGFSVCAGYARAYQLLMQTVGIPCFYIDGFGASEAHAWNLVKLDGEWYYSDPTWGDHHDVNYGELNCTYETMSQDHLFIEPSTYWLPKSTATAANYFYHDTIPCDTLDLPQLIDLMQVHNPLFLYVTGDRDAIQRLFWDNFQTITEALGSTSWQKANASPIDEHILMLSVTFSHTHDYQSLTLAPTCVTEGVTIQSCRICGESRLTNFVEPVGHSNVSYPAKTPTCLEQGWDAYDVCSVCTCSTQEKVWGDCTLEPSYVEPVTCTRDGFTMYVCTLCGLGYLRDIVTAPGHDMGIVPAKEPTCIESGWEAYEGCLRCGTGERKWLYSNCQWETLEERESTCSSQGYVHKRCTVCGGEQFDYPAPLGHTMVSYPAKVATCIEKGWDAYEECTVCGYNTKRSRWGSCEYEDTVVEPTCFSQGYTHHQCIYCGAKHDDTYVDPLEHQLVSYPAKEPTCIEQGWDAYEECTLCGICSKWPKWGDCQYEAYAITEPTCTQGGSIQSRCVLCGKEKLEPLYRLDHIMVTQPAKEATCIEPGWDAYEECTLCGENNREYVDGECHHEVSEVVTPTCTDGGYSVYRCIWCHTIYNDDFTEPLGHDLEEALSYNENGHGNLCRNCNKFQNFERHHSPCDVCGYGQAAVSPGDANDDGKVNNRDLGLLQRLLNEIEVSVNEKACDLNEDGKVNNRDLGLLQRLLNE